MHFHEIEEPLIEILQGAGGNYLLPYQIFMRLMERNPALGNRIIAEYPTEDVNPTMGKYSGIYYGPASFVSHALSHIKSEYPIDQRRLDSIDIEIQGVIPGNKEGTSIWAWQF